MKPTHVKLEIESRTPVPIPLHHTTPSAPSKTNQPNLKQVTFSIFRKKKNDSNPAEVNSVVETPN